MVDNDKAGRRARVWDLPTRVFHWLLAGAFLMAWLSRDDSRYLDVHLFAGYLFLGLLLFRLAWGFVGSHYARFREFAYPPREAWRYLKALCGDGRPRYVGHNPAGAWAIFALIGLGLLLTLSGLLVLGGEEQQGPLAHLIGFQQSPPLRSLHEFSAWTLLILVFIHIAGVIGESLLHRENLVGAMFRGAKRVGDEPVRVPAHRLLGGTVFVVAISWAGVMFGGYLTSRPGQEYLPFTGPALAGNPTWEAECGDCHLAFHPSLLPARSWRRLLDEQDRHFDEELMLDERVVRELRDYAVRNAAEQLATEAAWKIGRSIAADEAPLQITRTRYWKDKHRDIDESIWRRDDVRSRSNCAACHLDAESGLFQDSAMRIPGRNAGITGLGWLRSLLPGPSDKGETS